MSVGNVARVVAVLAACVAAVGSATSTSSSNQNASVSGPNQSSPPPPQQMDASRALGLWRSTFGAVKIEADASRGGLESGNLQGIWVYQRQGQEVVGYFAGSLRGNVLSFRWQEPNDPPLTGEGYLVFDPQGRQYSGRWWSDKRDRVGDWNGWRQASRPGMPRYVDTASPYGGQGYGAEQNPYRGQAPQRQPYQQPADPPPPYQRQSYPRRQPYQPQQQPAPQQPQDKPIYY